MDAIERAKALLTKQREREELQKKMIEALEEQNRLLKDYVKKLGGEL